MVQKINISFRFRVEKTNKEGYAPLYLILTKNNERVVKKCVPIRVKPKLDAKTLTKTKESVTYEVKKVTEKMAEMGMEITPKSVICALTDGIAEQRMTLRSVFDEFAKPLSSRVTNKTYNRYIRVMSTFSEFFNPDKPADQINRGHIERYKCWLESNYQNETVISYWKKLKSVVKYAIDCGYIKSNPFTATTVKKQRKEITYLKSDEIEKLRTAVMPNESLQNIVNCALLQLATGLAYCDLSQLKYDDINEEDGAWYIKKKRNKTGVEYVSYILPFGKEILDRHNGVPKVISNQKYNAYLKVIGDILNINQPLHTHLFRHTYACLLLNAGVPIQVVSKALGHTNITITQQHYAKLEAETVISTIKSHLK